MIGARSRLPIEIPPDATEVQVTGPRPFVTRVHYRGADGHVVDWSARRHRKVTDGSRGLTWWIGLLFTIGAACFAIGPIPAYEDAVGMGATDTTFFVGSLFFTAASYLSYMQVVRTGGRRWIGWTPQLMGFWATAIQFVGTLFFNVTTFAALASLTSPDAGQYVWRPDALGSVCFLIVVSHRLRRGRPPLVLLAPGQTRLAHHGAEHVGIGVLRNIGDRRVCGPRRADGEREVVQRRDVPGGRCASWSPRS